MKVLLALVLIVALVFAADSEERINKCNEAEIVLRVSKESCLSATAASRSANLDAVKHNDEYLAAAKAFDFADGELTVATADEHKAKINLHSAEASLKVARAAEDAFCNKLVRNVNPDTPCAKLLNKARKNNRLSQCRDAKKTLTAAEETYSKVKSVYDRLLSVYKSKLAVKIGKEKEREEAADRKKKFDGIFKTKNELKISACARYDSLKLAHYGKTRNCDAVDKNFCYRAIVSKTDLTWEQTEKMCKERGGHLLSIHNDFENTISDKLCKKYTNIVPIGLYDYSQSNKFQWSDGSKYGDYAGWAPGEPNQYNGGEPFGEEYLSNIGSDVRYQNKWNDIKGRTFKCFVCKFSNKNGRVFKVKSDRK